MIDAVIVSTARTALAKSWKGAFNLTHGATLAGHVVNRQTCAPTEDLLGSQVDQHVVGPAAAITPAITRLARRFSRCPPRP